MPSCARLIRPSRTHVPAAHRPGRRHAGQPPPALDEAPPRDHRQPAARSGTTGTTPATRSAAGCASTRNRSSCSPVTSPRTGRPTSPSAAPKPPSATRPSPATGFPATLARWCRIRSYLDSAAAHGITALDAIRTAIEGKPCTATPHRELIPIHGIPVEWTQPPVLLRDVNAAGRREPVFLPSHQPCDLFDLRLGHSVGRFLAGSGCHRPVVRVDVPVSQQIQVLIEHLPVKLRARQALPAAFAENVQHHFSRLHCASFMVAIRSSPVPLRPVVRFSRSPDWAGVTPPTTTGTPSP